MSHNILRIQRVSQIMRHLCTVGVVLIPVGFIFIGLNFEQFLPYIKVTQTIGVDVRTIGGLNLALGFLCMLLPAIALIYGLWQLHHLFDLYGQAKFFTETNARCLRAFAGALFINALLVPIAGILLSLALTFNNPPGQKALSISVGSGELETAFVAAIFWVIAWIMQEGRRLADENEQII